MSSGNGVKANSVKKPKLYSNAVIATPSRPRWRSARNGSASVVACSARGVDGSRNVVTMSAKAKRRLVEDDRLGHRSACRADDGGQRGGDEQRVAQSPECPPANDSQHAVGHAGQTRAGDDDQQAEQQR